MDQSLRLWCSHGGVVNGLSYEGGFTQILITDRTITLEGLRSLIIEKFSISYEFILRHVYETHCFLLDCEQAWSFVLEINVQAPFISIFITQAPQRFDNICSQRIIESCPTSSRHVASSSREAPSSSRQVAGYSQPAEEDDNTLALDSNDNPDNLQSDEDSDALIEDIDDFDDMVSNATTTELFIGQYFDNRSAFRTFISNVAIGHNFTCSAAEQNNAKGIIYTCNEPTCDWRVYARPIRQGGNIFQIATLENKHSCLGGLTTGSHPLATGSWIKNKIIDIIRDNQSYSPAQVVRDIRREHRINISYSKAWRAREMALAEINGSYFDAYSSLEEYGLRIIESNPGSSCFLKTNENNSFQRIFICFKACIDGFLAGCLPVISTDATFLSSKYQGILFIACAHDPNYKLYPLAYAVAEGENTDSWTWFLGSLRTSFERYFDDWSKIAFISDKQKGLLHAMRLTFPESPHFFCIQHFKNNMKSVTRTKKFHHMLDALARSYNKPDAEYLLEIIKTENIDMYNWLVGVNDETRNFAHWITAYSPCPRLDINTSNLAESFNNWIKNLRDKPITTLLDGIRAKIISLQDKNRQFAANLDVDYCPRMLQTIARINRENHQLHVLQFDSYTFELLDRATSRTYVVRLAEGYCSCLRWYHTFIPCLHACYAAKSCNTSIESYYCLIFSTNKLKSVYESRLEPIPLPYDLQGALVRGEIGVPDVRRKAGRPKKNRIKSKDDQTRDLRCSNCGGVGHNRRKCTSQPTH